MDGTGLVGEREGVSELGYGITACGVLQFPKYSKQKLLSLVLEDAMHAIQYTRHSYFTSLVCLFLGLLVAFWWLVFGENIFVLDSKKYVHYVRMHVAQALQG